eukprot:GHVU01097097.1.p1 GENE.GHVU01097097.1~~GHVU01097097.1.p1  ORF type:complete len:436 (-),score=96.72 GHVU01097097.1:241-1548(-)
MQPTSSGRKSRVCYYYDDEIGNFHYGLGHPMKPHRVRMTHDLIEAYNMHTMLDRMYPAIPSDEVVTRFHSDEYVEFLKTISLDNQADFLDGMHRFNVGEGDCPIFDGLWEFCGLYTGGSVGGAHRLIEGRHDVAVNWAGGLHHGKKHEASGFCYVNDCVLAALELLKFKHRVLYVDIDVHHGDGVEEAFFTSPRVMTVSFHKYGDYFPGTGSVEDIGVDRGKGYSVNVPLFNGCDDETFTWLFERVMDLVLLHFDPEAVILQSGADSLSGDRLGCFNLSLEGHSHASQWLRRKQIPLLVLGGGGYTMRNVPKCWAKETACMLKLDATPNIPTSCRYYNYYSPDHMLNVRTSNMENHNDRLYLENIIATVTENFRENVSPVCAQLTAASWVDRLPEAVRHFNDEDADPDANQDHDDGVFPGAGDGALMPTTCSSVS